MGITRCWSLSTQIITGRWFMVFTSILIFSVSGATYMFGLYSGAIKTSLGYNQSTLNLLSFFKDLGANVGIIAGLINEVSPPWVVLLIGAVMNFAGYFMVWLSVTGRVHTTIWQMCLFICVGANSQSFANTAALVTCVKNFPGSRGVVLGLLKGFVGLSGAIISQLYHGGISSSSSNNNETAGNLILLIAWLPSAVSVVFLATVRIMKTRRLGEDDENNKSEVKVFYNILYVSLGLAGLLMVLIILQNNLTFTRSEYCVSAFLVTVVLFLPLGIVIREDWKNHTTTDHHTTTQTDQTLQKKAAAEEEEVKTDPPPASSHNNISTTNCFKTVFNPPNRGDDYTILQALFSIDMLILFIATTAGVGGTLTAIDNLGQIGNSLGYPPRSITTFVSLVSIWNYLGRVTSGVVSEIFLTKYRFPRPAMLAVILLFSCIGHLLIALGVPNSLYIASMITGFCFGAQWPIVFAVISEIFGLKYYSTLLTFGSMASPVGSYVLSVLVTGKLYDREALRQLEERGLRREDGKELACSGTVCYRISFLVIIGATLFACLAAVVLAVRTRKFYRGDIYDKFRVINVDREGGGGVERPGKELTNVVHVNQEQHY